jgi:hypothetical protein
MMVDDTVNPFLERCGAEIDQEAQR